jgi:uncharacterized protein (TIGR02145 family)
MKKFFAIFAVLVLVRILVSCHTEQVEGNPFTMDDGGQVSVYSSSSSASVVLPSSSSSQLSPPSGSKGNNIANYRTVKIGDQIWMVENLDYAIEGSKCYDDQDSNCNTYGRLYDWETARVACPNGWHLPNDDEWNTLMNSVGGSSVAAKHLKAKEGWNSCGPSGSGKSYSCEDTYGFSARPGGYRYGGVNGNSGYWWSATVDQSSYSYHAYWYMLAYEEDVGRDYSHKDNMYSVRCVQGEASNLSSSSSFRSSSSLTLSSSSSSSIVIVTGSLYDSRDGQSYRTVVIGSQTWMAENLNYDSDDSVCYDNQNSYCNEYGKLYDWETARTACPNGWHLPNDDEWEALMNSVGDHSTAGKHLKAKEGWNSCGPSGSGKSYSCEDTYGFAALPGGEGTSGGNFFDAGGYGNWWSASDNDSDFASVRYMDYNFEYVIWSKYEKISMFSVRCVQD